MKSPLDRYPKTALFLLLNLAYCVYYYALDDGWMPCGTTLLGSHGDVDAVVYHRACLVEGGGKEVYMEYRTSSSSSAWKNAAFDTRYDDDDVVVLVGRLTGLVPSTPYQVRVVTNSGAGQSLNFTTFPAFHDRSEDAVRFLHSSCSSVTADPPWNSLHTAVSAMVGLEARFLMLLGDNVYADIHEMVPWRFDNLDINLRALKEFTPLMSRLPLFSMYDDHEVMNDFQGGASNPHFAEGMRYHVKYWASRNPGRGRDISRLWYSFDYGDLATFFVMDARTYADAATGTVFGTAQMDDLRGWMRRAHSMGFVHAVIASPVSWSRDGHGEAMRREKLEAFRYALRDVGLKNLLIVSGDMHYGAVYRYANGKILEVSASPLQAFPFWPQPEVDDDERRGGGADVEHERRVFIHGAGSFFGETTLARNGSVIFNLYRWDWLFTQWSHPQCIERFVHSGRGEK